MNFRILAILVAGIFGGSCGSPLSPRNASDVAPTRCVAPTYWEGIMSEHTIKGDKSSIQIMEVSYDAKKGRLRAASYPIENPRSVSYSVLEVLHITFFGKDPGSCYKFSRLPGTGFQTYEVPAAATYLARAYFGNSSFVDVWNYKEAVLPVPDGVDPEMGEVYEVWAADGSCLPVSITKISPEGTKITSFYNITLGIKDPSVWKVPDDCP